MQEVAAAPPPGRSVELAPGIRWLRLPLPFRLDHVNVYLLDDGDGVTLIDTGIGNAATIDLWGELLATERPIRRVIATHFHPDHVGMAGWLCERTGAPLLMAQTEYLTSLTIHLDPGALDAEPYRSFYLAHGLSPETTGRLLANGNNYLKMVTGLPRVFRRLIAGETLEIGGRQWEVLTGGGHAPEQVMLHCAADRILLAADQVMLRISPNIGVHAIDPGGDPLGIYLRSLGAMRQTIPADTVVLAGHNLPFTGLHGRIDELMAHHEARCAAVAEACAEAPHSAAELVPVVFGRTIDDPHQMGFAFGEALAHVNYMERRGALRFVDGRYRTVGETIRIQNIERSPTSIAS